MLNWLQGIGATLLGLLAPVATFAKQGAARGLSPAVRWCIHVVLVVLVCAGLFWLNGYLMRIGLFDIQRPAWARNVWLPLLFLLLYAAGWLAWLIWRLATADPNETPDPRIERAWAEACQALDHAGIRLADVPLFLVLGRPEAPEHFLFQGARLDLLVRQSPADPQAPLHVYANRDAIFVTCAASSLLGRHAANLALEGLADPGPGGAVPVDDDSTKTQVPKDREKREVRKAQLFSAQGAARTLERRQVRHALGLTTPNLLHRSDEVARLSGALAYLCRLIARDRQPQCPLNGILVLLPLGGTDTDANAQMTAEVLQRDLAVVRRVTRLHCPRFALLCDLESFAGFRDFVRRQGNRASRVGQRFPLESPDLQGEPLLAVLEQAVQSYCVRGLRELVYPLFDVKPAGEGDTTNRNLYLFLDQMRERKDRLGRLLVHGLRTADGGPVLFGGCYLAATGAVEDEQAYIKGLLSRLIDSQSFVQWSAEALQTDQRLNRIALLGYLVLGVLAVAAAGTGGYALLRRS